jgi:hypothetical protein
MKQPRYFRRPDLANRLAQQILSSETGSVAGSGVFFAAPRRTGKSTFLREDLRPALEAAGAFVLYVDLWADKRADPGEVIVSAVRSALSQFDGVMTRLARRTGLTSVSAGGMTLSVDKIGLGSAVSVSDALSELSDELKQPIVLIIDEAQHAIASDTGYDALFALKAARDELNSSEHFGLRIVATGSNRDKLAMLRNSKDQAFFGAPLIAFPPLDRNYIEWFCSGVSSIGPLNVESTWVLFQTAAFRPEILGAAVDELRFDVTLDPEELPGRFAAAVERQIHEAEAQTLQLLHSLTSLQSVVLRVLAARGNKFAPFESQTIDAYAVLLKKLYPKEQIVPDASNVQQALVALQEKLLVWKERRGIYALEDPSMFELVDGIGMLMHVPPITENG